MNTGFLLAISCVLILAAAGLWDVYALFFLPGTETVSYQLSHWAREIPAFPLLIGGIMGHLFFPLPRPPLS